MKYYIKFDGIAACKVIVKEHLDKRGIKYDLLSLGEITFNNKLDENELDKLKTDLSKYSIEIISNPKNQLVQRIKDTIIELVHEPDMPLTNISVYLSEKLNLSYGYISNIFSEYTYSSIENYLIVQKIERAKKLMIEEELTLTEVSYKLNYSSVAHLSGQFKKTTGLTPSMFKRIIEKRRISESVE
jgi:AraC-like DNA-binding protein